MAEANTIGLMEDSCDLPSSTHTIRANNTITGIVPKQEPSSITPAKSLVDITQKASTHSRFHRSKSLRSETTSSRKSNRKNVGIVIGNFTRIYPDELTLTLGERIDIVSKHVDISRNIDWWTARNSRGETGLVPVSCVKVVTSSVSSFDDEILSLTNASIYPIEIPPEEVTLLDVIGIGGFGRVHRAIYKGQEVAVKVARETNYDIVKIISEVLAEAEKFAKLAHENVCALVGVSLINDVYLVMEYAKGGSLSQAVHDKNLVVPIDIILDWALQIADGMQYLHHDVHPCMIHRDLKSSNILLQYDIDETNFNNNIIKITDFGLAREIEHTTRMSAAGTYPWMAPEVIKSSEFSTKSDVWSFGVVLWELLTGEKPYTGLNMYLVAYGVGSGSLNLPIHIDCPRPLSILLHECWQRSYMDRPTFRTIFSTLRYLTCQLNYEQFKSLQLSWKLEIQKSFQEHKKNESGFEDKQKDLLSKMRKQDQKVIQLEKEKLQLVNMIDKFHAELQNLNESEQRPPRVKPFSFRRIIEKMMVNRDPKTKTKDSSSKVETLAKEIQRKMKDIDVTEDLLLKYSQTCHKRPSLPITAHTRQISDSGTHISPILSGSAIQRSGSLKTNNEQKPTPPHLRTGSKAKDHSDNIPRRYNSYDNIIPSSDQSKTSQFDSGQDSLTSSFSNYSNEVQNLIDFDDIVSRPNIIADLDPLYQPPQLIGQHIIPTSHDSLFSEIISPVSGARGFSPPIQSSLTHHYNVSPRSSTTDINPRPRPRPTSQDSISAPASRPGTPKLRPQSSNISPSGSIQSLPLYRMNSNSDVSYFASDSYTSVDLIDDALFANQTDNMIYFPTPSLTNNYQ